MQLTMSYGKTGYRLTLPDAFDVTVFEKNKMPCLPDPETSVRKALFHSRSAPTLPRAAAGCRTACILICDITRPVPNPAILPPLIRGLTDSGISTENILLLVATGLHRPSTADELREMIGQDPLVNRVRVVNHIADSEKDHADLGLTDSGVPIKIDRRFLDADFRVAIGLVEPHFMAGYSGGRKVIVPGIAHRDTIARLHAAALLEHPRARNCVLDGNPLHEAQMDIVARLGSIYATNAVIDAARRLSFVNFGPLCSSHLAAVSFLKPYAEIPTAERFATVVTSAGGYPLDKTYYQTVKGMVGAMGLLEKGGDLIIFSECSEGLGSDAYVAAQRRLIARGPEAFLSALMEKQQAAVDEWQTEMQARVMRQATVHLYSETLSTSDQALTGVRRTRSPEQTIGESVRAGKDLRVAVIPEGPYVIPVEAG